MTAIEPSPRILPLNPPYDPATEAMLNRWMPPQSPLDPLRLFRTLAVHDELMSRMRPLGAGILAHGRVSAREREIIIHRTCARAGAEYEWGVHAVAYGKPVGFTDEQLDATVRGGSDDPVWSETDATLVRFADELHENGRVSDVVWDALVERYRDDQLLELVIIAGWYRLISYVVNSARVELEEWAARFPPVP
jgi:4-carboxymuconolactone decarboxylase